MSFIIEDERFYTVQDLVKETGFSQSSLWAAIRNGKLKANKAVKPYTVIGKDFKSYLAGEPGK